MVVPSRNEKGNLAELVRRIPEFPGGAEIVYVDGDSTDGSLEEIQRLKDAHPEKMIRIFREPKPWGKAAAVWLGFKEAKGDILIILDADLSVDPEILPQFDSALTSGQGDFINGTRMVHPMEKRAMRFLNYFGNRFFAPLLSFLIGQKITDTLCGTKALRRADYERMAKSLEFTKRIDPFGDFTLLLGAASLGLKIVEIPVSYRSRVYGKTKISRFWDGARLFLICFFISAEIAVVSIKKWFVANYR